MFKPVIFNKGMENDLKSIRLPFNAEIHNNVIDPKIGMSGGKRILNIVCECPPFRIANEVIISRLHEFDLILTSDEDILAQCGNASKMLFGTSWIRPGDRAKAWNNKEYGVSFVCGSKNKTEGQKLRHEIWKRQEEIKMPSHFWSSSRNPIPSKGLTLPIDPSGKIMAFSDQFHIVIENTKARNYFTEKLIDCFMTRTVPVYWGCPNIGDYFDIEGILCVKDENDIINKCNHFNKNTYIKIINSVSKNYQLALRYARPIGIMLQERIIEVLR